MEPDPSMMGYVTICQQYFEPGKYTEIVWIHIEIYHHFDYPNTCKGFIVISLRIHSCLNMMENGCIKRNN
jgi:hypothetical protein